MKKIAVVLALLLFLMAAAACEERTRPSGQEQLSESEEEQQTDPEPEQSSSESSGEELSEESDEESGEEDPTEVRAVVGDLMDALKTGQPDVIRSRIDYTNLLQLESGQSDTNARAILQHLQYSIDEAEVSGEVATVTVTISNVDMEELLPSYLKQAMDLEYNNALEEAPLSAEEMELRYEALFADLLNQSGTTRSRTVDIKLLRTGDKWTPQVSESLRDAVLGGYIEAVKKRGQNAGGGA